MFMVDADGDVFANGSAVHDSYCDAQLARALDIATADAGRDSGHLIRSEWDRFVQYNECSLVEANILGAPLACGGLLNVTGLQRLHNGAIWQLHTKVEGQRLELDTIKQQMQALMEAK